MEKTPLPREVAKLFPALELILPKETLGAISAVNPNELHLRDEDFGRRARCRPRRNAQ